MHAVQILWTIFCKTISQYLQYTEHHVKAKWWEIDRQWYFNFMKSPDPIFQELEYSFSVILKPMNILIYYERRIYVVLTLITQAIWHWKDMMMRLSLIVRAKLLFMNCLEWSCARVGWQLSDFSHFLFTFLPQNNSSLLHFLQTYSNGSIPWCHMSCLKIVIKF